MTDTPQVRPSGPQTAELSGLEIVEELGRGAFTMVHHVRRGEHDYALKRPLADAGELPELRTAFQREAALLACIDDPGVVGVHAVGEIDGVPGLVLEHLSGGALSDLLVYGILSQERCVELAAQLTRGLAAAHRVGLVHRDIKPDNIMIAGDGRAKLIDFGLAQLGRDTDADSDQAVGTFLYTSPEQSGMLRRPVDGRSDLYSLGVVLFECLTGRLPFEADDVGELLRLHLAAPVPDVREKRPDVDPALAAVVHRLLAKDPDDRYPDAAGLLSALRHCPGGASAEEPAASRWPMCGRDAEADRLARRWERARAGLGGVVLIHGAAGSGRTRLAEHAAGLASVSAMPVLWGTCRPDEPAPLAVLREAVQASMARVQRLADEPRAAAEKNIAEAAAAAGVAQVIKIFGDLGLLDVSGQPAAGDEHVFAAGAAFLGDLARRADGMLLVIDDAHLLDNATRQLLAALAPDLPSLPLLVLMTDTGDGAADLGVPGTLELTCTPLPPPVVGEVVASRLPGAAVPAELARHVTVRTDGTPLAVVSYLMRLLDAGLLGPLWGTWHLDTVGADALPSASGIRDLLAARLAGLSEPVLDVLTTAAVAGVRFRPEGLPGDGERTALEAGLERHVLEVRAGGWYAFVHPQLRDTLLERLGPDELRQRHAAAAAALERLPEELRDEAHAYAVARHYQRAGDAAPIADRRRTAAAAGLRALADQAPEEAVGYLVEAIDGDPAPAAAMLHSLAEAYLRAGRFPQAEATLDRALAVEPDRVARARMHLTRIELAHTIWDDTRALEAARDALTELGRPLPRHPLLLILSTLAYAFAGAVVRRTKIGFGRAEGQRREVLAALTAVLDAGGYAAIIGLRLREAGILGMRAMYAVNRLGPSPEYARVYALVGYVSSLIRLRSTGQRCQRRAMRIATDLGDPVLIAYVDWINGCSMLLGGYDDGSTWEKAITRNARWYEPAQLLPGYASQGLRLLLRGYPADAEREYERGLRGVADPALTYGTSLSMLGAMVPAYQGRFGEAAAAVKRLRDAIPPGTGTRVQHANILVAAAAVLLEQGEIGESFDEVMAEFRGLGLRTRDLMVQHKWILAFAAHARLIRLRYSSDEDRPARLAEAVTAIRELGRAGGSPLIKLSYRLSQASLAQMSGDQERGLKLADEAEKTARALDAPMAHYEICKIRARALRALGLNHEADRQARSALALATFYGWEQRRRQTRTEFGVDEGASTHRRTVAERRGPATGRNRRLEALQQVSTAAATVLDPQQLAQVALDETLRILGAERALFFLLDEAGEPVRFAGRDAAGELTDTMEYGATLVRRVAETGEAVVVTGTEQGAALGSRSAVAHGLRSILVAPVQFKGRLIGVVYLDSRLARGIFTDDDVDVLTAVSSHVAISLETARAAQLHLAVQAAQQQQALAETLRASLAELTSILEPDRLLRRLSGTLQSTLGAGSSCLVSPDGEVLEPAEIAGGRLTPDEVALVGGLTEPALLDPAGTGGLRERLLAGDPVALAVPLDGRDGRAGTVLLGGAALDDTSRQVAAALATQGMTAYDNARLFSRVQELATTDELTGQHNRRHFYAVAGALVQAAARNGRPLAAAMLDIDKFKSVNDTYGHGVGDEVIRTVARRIRAVLRHSDVLGRYGGEEFAIVLPDHEGEAMELAERVRMAVGGEPVATQAGPLPVTISIGLTRLGDDDTALDDLLARADHALYRAKEAGRNRVMAD
ncbi:serine/threonine protein kinase [Actinoplanes sp. SE50]|uniref:diguanylate cyclase n=1 Tax=unclassified Actinoplanes TaxID=2626549 RepID=UPI00023EC072|nr:MULTISPECIES: diguanylate cyclase [unclassified Actinoplanes]AEV82964.1 serine/threonine protein kinase [Actinoplanes sp. SE50/110]ATO81360.1 serine/threonine protein kinase [Actinoplanes sp. SE50]SLL98767.1 serine/threonine protein kinase [Actinoplanes sp. SE50/110]